MLLSIKKTSKDVSKASIRDPFSLDTCKYFSIFNFEQKTDDDAKEVTIQNLDVFFGHMRTFFKSFFNYLIICIWNYNLATSIFFGCYFKRKTKEYANIQVTISVDAFVLIVWNFLVVIKIRRVRLGKRVPWSRQVTPIRMRMR